MGKLLHQNIDTSKAKRDELRRLLLDCQNQVNELTQHLEEGSERLTPVELVYSEKLLEAVNALMNTVSTDLQALQEQIRLYAATQMPRNPTCPEVATVKNQIAALEATRQRLDSSLATTRHNLESADSMIDDRLRYARERLAVLMR